MLSIIVVEIEEAAVGLSRLGLSLAFSYCRWLPPWSAHEIAVRQATTDFHLDFYLFLEK